MKSIIFITDDPGVGGVHQYNLSISKILRHRKYKLMHIRDVDIEIAKNDQLFFEKLEQPVHFIKNLEDFNNLLFKSNAHIDLIIFSNSSPFSNFEFKRVAINCNIPFVVVEGLVEPYLSFKHSKYLPELTFHYQNAKEVIAVSQDNLYSLYNFFGLPSHKGKVIHYGRPECFFKERQIAIRQRIRQKLGIEEDKIVCITTARIEERKGYQYLLDAIRHLIKSELWHKLHFLWIGGSFFAPQLEEYFTKQIQNLGAQKKVTILEQQPNIADYLDAADIFILPSKAEGMPLSIMEAMAKGIPVIASAVNGIPEELGDTGHLLPDPNVNPQGMGLQIAETIEDWVTRPHKRLAEGKKGRDRAKLMFKEEHMTDRTLQVIKQALLQKKRLYIS
ncbi:MAG: glycosyltransferase family 4 protein [Synechococcaceae cyanobacterium RL_1_2]|nr:glycosyltransferase family 4 protein [Synechococcaceae cyanobacterium RL_1_2]